MVEMAKSQIEFSNSQAHFINETRIILQIQLEQLKGFEMQVGQMDKILPKNNKRVCLHLRNLAKWR